MTAPITIVRQAGQIARNRVADNGTSTSLASRARAKRFNKLMATFPDLAEMRVLDLGGTTRFWASAPVRPGALTLVNPDPGSTSELGCADVIDGDACEPPARVLSRDYDLVYSNSTIEHVGGHRRRSQFADIAKTAAPHMWVQTPYRYFPLEPHFLFPLFQHLPVSSRMALASWWPFTPPGFPTARDSVRSELMSIELLSRTEMQAYFPNSTLHFERIGGIPKSLIAVR